MRRLITAPGALTEPTAQALETALEANDQGFWLDIENPDEPDYALLQEIFHFHPLTLEDIRHENQRPKLEEYGEYSFAVLFTADWSGQELKIREHHLYISKRYLVSVHLEPSPELEQIHQRLKATPELTKKGLPFLFYLVVDKLVDEVFTVIDQLDAATDTLEDAILARDNREALGQIYGLKRAVVDLRKVLGAQRDLFQRLTTQSLDEQEMTLYFRDVYDHVVRQYETVDSLRDLLTSAMDVYLSTVSNRLNEIMRRLTVIATLFMPLTFITGFFGMNFLWLVNHISTFGAFMVGIGLMVATLMAQFLYFRRSGWV
ncbi:MAG TPA: magnesium/cobalt transporter CorA [Candidatus Dormibacteraeota bacterium]|jgi:magnesium transporter